ncbi:WD domain-containing protein [Stipitochalara longipes BDJ]|nr:WD domain-containing protein [Stipitochalara longipes BDJ]
MALPPATPAYILRGHGSQIHATTFVRSNRRLMTGDADGWIVLWSLTIKRPVAVWRAHQGSILGASAWGSDKYITHGKDNKLIVWKLSEEDEASMSTVLPVDTPPEPRKQPWLLHILEVNTMNFCSFAQADLRTNSEDSEELLLAVPNTMSSETVDIFHLPSSKRIHTIPASPIFKGGMIMALSLFFHPLTSHLTVLAGYESGHTAVSCLSTSWQTLYVANPHSQPILSLDVNPGKDFYFTSSADAVLAKHPVPLSNDDVIGTVESMPLKVLKTKHSGQQGLKVRNDGKVLATAGWDGRVRVYGVKGMKELAVLKWHKEGCYAVAFADVDLEDKEVSEELEGQEGNGKELASRMGTMTVREEREQKAKTTHWLAVGSKDGKVSLWDIY